MSPYLLLTWCTDTTKYEKWVDICLLWHINFQNLTSQFSSEIFQLKEDVVIPFHMWFAIQTLILTNSISNPNVQYDKVAICQDWNKKNQKHCYLFDNAFTTKLTWLIQKYELYSQIFWQNCSSLKFQNSFILVCPNHAVERVRFHFHQSFLGCLYVQ